MPRRTILQRERERTEALRLNLRGWSENRIAAKLGVDHKTVFKDLQAVREEYIRRQGLKREVLIARELEQIEGLQVTAWEAWDRSLEPRKSTATERSERSDGGEDGKGRTRRKATVKEEEMLGEPRYLEQVSWCIDRRIRLLGLDAPSKVAVTDSQGRDLFTVEQIDEVLRAAGRTE